MRATLLEVVRAEEADLLAQKEMSWYMYEPPKNGQEYIAVHVSLERVEGDPNEFESLYGYWSFTIRYSETGPDTWTADIGGGPWAEGYIPVEGNGWLFFLIREGSEPLLYFHPNLIIVETFGIRTGGGFFSLDIPDA